MAPLVSVLMLVKEDTPYAYFKEAVESVQSQTLSDFELILIDGGIKGEAQAFLESTAQNDRRIRVVPQPSPGLSVNRNLAMSLATGKYCAVADADDVFLPERLEKEVRFLESAPDIMLVGSAVRTFGNANSEVWLYPADSAAILCELLFQNTFAHSTVMWRRESIIKTKIHYRLNFAEDYDYFCKLSEVIKMANLPDVLVNYRIHPSQMTQAEPLGLINSLKIIHFNQIQKLGIEPTDLEMDLHLKVAENKSDIHNDFFRSIDTWLLKLLAANKQVKIYPEPQFSRTLAEHWWLINQQSQPYWRFIRRILSSHLINQLQGSMRIKIRFLMRPGTKVIKRLFLSLKNN